MGMKAWELGVFITSYIGVFRSSAEKEDWESVSILSILFITRKPS